MRSLSSLVRILEDIIDVFRIAPFQAVLGGLMLGGREEDEWWKTLAFDVLAAASGPNTTLFKTLKVQDLIFGYEDSLLEFISKLKPGVSPQFQLQINETSLEDAMKTEGTTIINTGKKDIVQIASYLMYENKTHETCWGSEEANQIRGTGASQFYPGISIHDKPEVYVDNIFR